MQGCPEWRAGYFIYYSTALDLAQIRECLKAFSIAGDIYAN